MTGAATGAALIGVGDAVVDAAVASCEGEEAPPDDTATGDAIGDSFSVAADAV